MSGKQTERGFVLVTGTSTGIGAATARHLVEQGFHVFAGVRRKADGRALEEEAPGKVTPLIVDVTDAAAISKASAAVAKAVGNRGLAGLVNNAGIGKPAPIEFQPMVDFRTQLEVNLFGPVAMTQAFLPLNGAYSASKFGIRAVSDALRLELRQWGIHVSLIEVAPVRSAIYGKTYAEFDALEERLGEAGFRLYEQQIAAVRKAVEKAEATADPALVIAKAVEDALTSDKPKPRYLVGHGAKATGVAAALPDRARDGALAKELGLPKPE